MENAIETKARIMAKTCDTINGDVKDDFVLFFGVAAIVVVICAKSQIFAFGSV